MNSKYLVNLFFIWLVAILSLSSLVAPLKARADETTNAPSVLGRTDRLANVCDDFEDPDWKYVNLKSSNKFWIGTTGLNKSDPSDRGSPKIVERVTPPHKGGKRGSTGALKIGTSIPHYDNWPSQDDLRTAEFEEKLKRQLKVTSEPVFIVHVWLPPFDEWGEQYDFGFRVEAQSNSTPDSYYPSIWLKYNPAIQGENESRVLPGAYFFFRICFLVYVHDESGVKIVVNKWDEQGGFYWSARLVDISYCI